MARTSSAEAFSQTTPIEETEDFYVGEARP